MSTKSAHTQKLLYIRSKKVDKFIRNHTILMKFVLYVSASDIYFLSMLFYKIWVLFRGNRDFMML
jgi:hypothetical protein